MKSLMSLFSIKNFTIWFILFWLGLFILVPGILVVIVSFLTQDPLSFYKVAFSLDSWTHLFDPIYAKVFWNSIVLAFWTTLVTLIVGYAYSMAVANCKKMWQTILLIAILLPFWTNSLVRIYGIKVLFGVNGIINWCLVHLGFHKVHFLYNNTAVVIGMVSILLPYMILPIYSSLEKIDNRLLEAAKDLGAGPFRRFTKVIFPLSFPGVVAGFTLVFLPSMGMFYVADLLGGPRALLIGKVIKDQFLFTRNWPLGAVLSLCMIFILMITIWLVNLIKIGNVEGDRKNGS